MFCEKCGAQIAPGEMFCPNCGARAPQTADSTEPINTGYVNPGAAASGNTGYVNMGAAMPGNTGYVDPGAADPRNTGYVNMGAQYAQAPYGQAPYAAQTGKPKKKSALPFIIGGVALAAVIAVAAILLLSKPYIKPIDTLFKAYNTNNLALLQEALSDDLYSHWNWNAVTDYVNDDSYKVLGSERMTGSELDAAKADWGVTKCYKVSIEETNYDSYNGVYNTYYDTIVVGKKNGVWKIYDLY